MRGVQAADAMAITDEQLVLNVPVLLIRGSLDAVTAADHMEPQTAPYASAGYEVQTLEGGHWLMLELPEEFSELLIEFATREV